MARVAPDRSDAAAALVASIRPLAPTGCETLLWSLLAPRWARMKKCRHIRTGRTRQGRLAAVFFNSGFGNHFAIALAMPAEFGLAEIVDPKEVEEAPIR